MVHTTVETPVNLNEAQKDLLKSFAEAGTADTNPETESFFSKVKELWEDLKD